MIPALIIAAIWNIINAEWDAYQIRKDKHPNHNANGGIYVAVTIGLCFFGTWVLAIPILFLRPLLFDQYLNVRRGLPFTYQPGPDPEDVGSFVDRKENEIFGHDKAWKYSNAIYLVGFIAGILIYVL